MKPTVGRIVHFVSMSDELSTGPHLAAIVVAVLDSGRINLAVFSHDGSIQSHIDVQQDETAEVVCTWHWPERD
jgi:hypothetical protein